VTTVTQRQQQQQQQWSPGGRRCGQWLLAAVIVLCGLLSVDIGLGVLHGCGRAIAADAFAPSSFKSHHRTVSSVDRRFVKVVSNTRHRLIAFIEQYKWFGLPFTVNTCLFLMCATDVYFYLMLYV